MSRWGASHSGPQCTCASGRSPSFSSAPAGLHPPGSARWGGRALTLTPLGGEHGTWDEPPGSWGPAPLSRPGLPWGFPHDPRTSSVLVSSRIPRAWPPSSSQLHSQVLSVCRTQEGQYGSLLASGPLSSQHPPTCSPGSPRVLEAVPQNLGEQSSPQSCADTGRRLQGLTPPEGAEGGSQGGGGGWVSPGRGQGFHGTRRGWRSQGPRISGGSGRGFGLAYGENRYKTTQVPRLS